MCPGNGTIQCALGMGLANVPWERHYYMCPWYETTVDSGYQAHALVGTIAKIYALHNEVRYITGVKD